MKFPFLPSPYLLRLFATVFLLWTSPALSAPPNVLLILVDDLGYADLGCYAHGTSDLQTPHLDRLAAQGMLFRQAYASSSVCSPTRAAVLTGLYPDMAGVPGVIRTHAANSWGYLKPDAQLLPALLRRAGYHTAIIGKWHLGLDADSHPLARGFDFFHGFLGDMMDDYYHHRRHGLNYMRRNREVIEPDGHATDLFSNWAIDYLGERRKQEAPWFLYLAYNAPHTPIQPPAESLEAVQKREPDMDPKRARLAALIEHLDAGVGRVLAALDRNGQAESTLVVFVSDNGGQLNVGANCGPYRGGKQDLYEGGLRVPCLVRWPGEVDPGTVSDRVVASVDLLPTICEAAGLPWYHRLDGASFLPTLRGEPSVPSSRALFFMRREGSGPYQGQDYYAVRQGHWKLLHNSPFEPLELYHLGNDPTESIDLADKEREVYRHLTRLLRAQIQRAGAVPWQRP